MRRTSKLAAIYLLCCCRAACTSAFHSRYVGPVEHHPATTRTPGRHEGALLQVSATKPNSEPIRRIKTKPPPSPKKVYLTHERDFFRQETRLESMESYALVSTLTSSMSFGALLSFTPSLTSKALFHIQGATAKFLYKSMLLAIEVVAGLSTLCGLYATLIFSLTILYGKSALGAERDVEYDEFLRSTVRARVHAFRSFTYSLGLFALLAMLVLVERTSFRACSLPVLGTASYILIKLYWDWRLLFEKAEIIYKDNTIP